MKIRECNRERIYDIGFIDPDVIHEYTVLNNPEETKANLLRFLKKQNTRTEILFPYNFK